jgi:hypothetical protein
VGRIKLGLVGRVEIDLYNAELPYKFPSLFGGHLICVKNPLRKGLTPTPLVGYMMTYS